MSSSDDEASRQRRGVIAATCATSSVIIPFAIGAALGPLPDEHALEPRVAWVFALASILALASWVLLRDPLAPRRFAPLAGLVVPVTHVLVSRSSAIAALDGVLLVLVSFGVIAHVQWSAIARRRALSRARVVSTFVAGVLAHGLVVLVGFGVVSCVVVPAIVRVAHPTPALEGDERAIEIIADDGVALHATYFPGAPGGVAIVLAHGRGDGRDRMLGWARELSARGAHVITYDGRAHAASEGAVVTFADREPRDVVRVVDTLIERSGVAPSSVAVMGVSMGGGAVLGALPALDRRGVRRAVLLAPASDYHALVDAFLPPGPLRAPSRVIVDGVSHAMGFASPLDQIPRDALRDAPHVEVLLLHPRADRTIPLALSEQLVAEHPRVTLRVIEHGGHDHFEGAMRVDPTERDAILAALGL